MTSKRRLALQTLGALAAAAAVTVLAVAPAEWGIDPTGFGRLTGLIRLAAPQEARLSAQESRLATAVHHPAPAPFRSDVLEIRLAPGGTAGGEVERKVWMEPGQTFVYAWTADGEVYSDFHGETLPEPVIQVMTYRVEDPLAGGAARAASGGFTAPMAGFHGWFFRNLEGRPVTIRVSLSGFYDLRPYVTPEGQHEVQEIGPPG